MKFFYPLELLLKTIFIYSYKFTNNYGISLLCMSFIITLCVTPLYFLADKWQDDEKQLQDKMKSDLDSINNHFSGTKKFYLTQTCYRLFNYKLWYPLRTSFGILLQIPFFFAAYNMLSHFPEYKNVSFGVISDLGSPDSLLFGLNLLPFVMTLTNLFSSFLYTNSFSYKNNKQQIIMALVFLVLLYDSPSALLIYWTSNNFLSLLKNTIVRLYKKKDIRNNSLKLNKCIRHHFSQISFTLMQSLYIRLIILFCFCIISPIHLFCENITEFHFSGYYLLKKLIFYFIISVVFALFDIIINFFVKSKRKITVAVDCIIVFLFFLYLANAFLLPLDAGTLSEYTFQKDSVIIHPDKFLLIKDVIIFFLVFQFTLFIINKSSTALLSVLTISVFCIACSTVISYKRNHNLPRDIYNDFSTSLPDLSEKVNVFSKNGKNVVFFLPDMCNGNYLGQILQDDPESLAEFTGFTWYKDTLSISGSTVSSLPSIFGGEEYTPLELNKTDNEYQYDAQQAIQKFFVPFLNEGYNVSHLYEWGGIRLDISKIEKSNLFHDESIFDYIGAWTKLRNVKIENGKEKVFLLQMLPVYQLVPNYFKNIIYDDGIWNNIAAKLENTKLHVCKNKAYLDLLPEIAAVSENIGNTFLFVHHALSHDPYGITNNGHFINTLKEQQDSRLPYYSAKETMKLCSSFIAWLKIKGIYDNTMIIILSDHGNSYNDNDVVNFFDKKRISELSRAHALFLLKDFNAPQVPLKISYAQMQNSDIQSLFQEKVFNLNHDFSEKEQKNNRIRTFSCFINFTNDYPYKKNMSYSSYKVSGSMFDENSWEYFDER